MDSDIDHVRDRVPDQRADDLSDDWWREASYRAMTEFIRVNHLGDLLTHYLEALERMNGRFLAADQ